MFNPLKAELEKLRIVLATSSKQRHAILQQTGIKFDVIISDYVENLDRNKYSFSEYVQETAFGKVQAVIEKLSSQGGSADVIIGLDTMVACGDQFFGKPKNTDNAFETIKFLTRSDLPNEVFTGVCIKYKDSIHKFTEVTKVYMRPLTDEEILGYIETGEPMGHAGSYAIQGIASSFVKRIEGDYNNVIGLPLCSITKVLSKLVKNDQKLYSFEEVNQI